MWQVVDLVRDQKHRLRGLPQHFGQGLVERMHAILAIHEEKDHVGLFDRRERLMPDRSVEGLVAALDDTTSIDNEEVTPAPVGRCKVAVSSDTRTIIDDRAPRPDHPVEERRLSYVGTADNRDDGKPPAQAILRASVIS